MKYLKVSEIAERYGITSDELERLAREEIIEIKQTLEEEPVVSCDDVEKARLAMLLMNELEVNLAGAEVAVHMRDAMVAMQRQFGKILEVLIEEIRRAAGR
jgi:hypothetical protein